jgi:AraC-like DNA-binding protein
MQSQSIVIDNVLADDFYNQVVPLDLVWGSRVTQLRDRLREGVTVGEKFRVLETALLQVLQRGAEKRLALHPSVQYALGEFRRVPHIRSVIGVAREAGLSRRRFSQLFREQVGITTACAADHFRRASGLGGCGASRRLLRSGAFGSRVSGFLGHLPR